MPVKKKKRNVKRVRRHIDVDRGVENFGHEVEGIGQRMGDRMRTKRLYRSGKDKILGGVCGGIGEYLGVDPVLIRILWVFSIFAWGIGTLPYLIAWIIIPRNPRHVWKD